MIDLFDKIKSKPGPLEMWHDKAEGYYMFPELEGEIGSHMYFQGKEVLCWSLNNYLGLANHPEVRKADAEAAAKYGMAYPMGARVMSGQTKWHKQLEQELANFSHKQYGCLINYGYQGIMSTIDCLLDRHDVVVYDADCHASIIDGIRMSPADKYKFRHNDVADAEKRIAIACKLAEQKGGGVLVITEGVFGMRGMQGKVKGLADLKKKYTFRLLIDDAHGFGTQGEDGGGTHVEQGCADEVDVYCATFAKSMASTGGFIATNDKAIITHIRYNMRSQIYAKSMPLVNVMGGLKRLELIRNHPEFRTKLWENVRMLQNGLRERGFDIGDLTSCVTPVYMKGSLEEATQVVADMRENYRIFCSIVIPPVIPAGNILLRLIPTNYHTKEDIEYTLNAFAEVRDKLANHQYVTDRVADVQLDK
ncbi:MAG: pyridoxal phosphate-dependent aminotransferase family protein [Flavobacteriales bacterium]|nr:pyridoxal phosphate-dependent aminotransferase family protein [Flavobacteriales bacterium]